MGVLVGGPVDVLASVLVGGAVGVMASDHIVDLILCPVPGMHTTEQVPPPWD